MHPDADYERLETGSLSRAVRALMLRKGIGTRQQSKLLAQILCLSYSQAHRKIQGEVDWTLTQLSTVVAYFQESLGCLGLSAVELHDGLRSLRKVDATLELAGTERSFRCVVWLGDKLSGACSAEFVAQNVADNWTVVETGSRLPNLLSHHVVRLELVLAQPPVIKVAVQFNHIELWRELSEYFRGEGLEAYILERDSNCIVGHIFDAYIIDWPINGDCGQYSVAEIRDIIGSRVPIYLLSDPVKVGSVQESQLTQLVTAFGVFWRERPLRISALVAELRSVVQIINDDGDTR